eukprot:scaffold3743_cov155-Skeletonema_menzelii.AAC.7
MPPIDTYLVDVSSPIEIEVSMSMSGESSTDDHNNTSSFDNGGCRAKSTTVDEENNAIALTPLTSSSSSSNAVQRRDDEKNNDDTDNNTALNGVNKNASASPSSRTMATKPSHSSRGDTADKNASVTSVPAAASVESDTAISNTNEYSRRLVEYFVIISSVPKKRHRRRRSRGISDASSVVVDNIPDQHHQQTSPITPASPASQRKAARFDARKAHLQGDERDVSPGARERQQQEQYESPGVDLWDLPPSGSGLQGDQNAKINKSVGRVPPPPPSLSPYHNGPSPTTRRNKFSKKISSISFDMSEQKKKITKQTESFEKKLKSTMSTEKIERQLEKLKLEKTLIKLKSMKKVGGNKVVDDEEGIAAHCNNANNVLKAARQQHQQHFQEEIGHSMSSASSVLSDGNDNNEDDAESIMSDQIRPSQHPTSIRNLPSSIHPPPPPPGSMHTPPAAPLPRHSFGGNWTPEWTPGAESVDGRGGGASENIRIIGSDNNQFCDREYNDDIDDCILEPVITSQYPPVDHPGQPLNPMLPHFCYPQGIDQIVPSHEYIMPRIHHFVLTDSAGGKLYGTCLTVYEEFSNGGDDTSNCDDDISLLSEREEDQERANIEISIDGSPKVVRARRRSRHHTYYAPRVLCLLSTWPYLSAFRTYLTQLYRLATATSLMKAPIERYIQNICSEVPAPPPGSFEVKLSILDTQIRFWAPPADQPIPYVSLNYGVLFECLDIGNVLFVWYTLACERKILLVSSQLSLLTICAEILCSMLFPMRWSHLYIPVLPRFLTPMLDAPMPYLCGISRDIFPHAVADISDETVVVDLDRNLVTLGTNTLDLPILSHRRKMKLESALEKNAGDVFWHARGLTKSEVDAVRSSGDENELEKMLGTADAVWDEKICCMDDAFNLAHSPDSMNILHNSDDDPNDLKQSRWDVVQEAFLRFYVSMLKDYRKYMPESSKVLSSWRDPGAMESGRFLTDEFVNSQRQDYRPFLEELVGTQQFDDFVSRRMYNAADAPDVKFFDQSIEAKKNRSKLKLKKVETPFLNAASSHRDMKQIEAIEPNKKKVPPPPYIYKTWPETFDESLYGIPRPIPGIITSEFDRRSALIAMLKKEHGIVDEETFPGSNNPSAEATAFVLFFVTFTQIIGREWNALDVPYTAMFGKGDTTDGEESFSGSSASPWMPKVNPPWMAEESFNSLHTNGRPKDDTEVIVSSDLQADTCCDQDCTNICANIGQVIDPSNFNPWTAVKTAGNAEEKNPFGGSDMANYGAPPVETTPKSPLGEEVENQITKARAIAVAQIDLGYNTLRMMRMRKLPTESITYKALIEACGRCGISDRANQLMEMMTQDGLALDAETYFCFIKAFSNNEGGAIPPLSTDAISEISIGRESSIVSASTNNLSTSDGNKSRADKRGSIMYGIQNAVSSTIAANRRAFRTAKQKRLKRLGKRRLTKQSNLSVTKTVKTQLDMGNAILEDLYPGIKIDTSSDACPKCSYVLDEDSIILGWKPCEVKDFSTTCPSCKHKFIPKFSVSCNLESFMGSQGKATPLYCDYLSPWVLLQEIRGLINTERAPQLASKAAKFFGIEDDSNNVEVKGGVDAIIDPKFRDGNGINATLWWNMIVTFRRFKIPFTFLLQGSYKDQQLIMPLLEDM